MGVFSVVFLASCTTGRNPSGPLSGGGGLIKVSRVSKTVVWCGKLTANYRSLSYLRWISFCKGEISFPIKAKKSYHWAKNTASETHP